MAALEDVEALHLWEGRREKGEEEGRVVWRRAKLRVRRREKGEAATYLGIPGRGGHELMGGEDVELIGVGDAEGLPGAGLEGHLVLLVHAGADGGRHVSGVGRGIGRVPPVAQRLEHVHGLAQVLIFGEGGRGKGGGLEREEGVVCCKEREERGRRGLPVSRRRRGLERLQARWPCACRMPQGRGGAG